MRTYIEIGDEVSESPAGPGKIAGVNVDGYPIVNGFAVGWLNLPDGRRFDPHGRGDKISIRGVKKEDCVYLKYLPDE